MPSEKKASEGIALLSMYGDEDDEMEDLDEEEADIREEEIPPPMSDVVNEENINDYVKEISPRLQEERGGTSSENATPQQQQQLQEQTVRLNFNHVQIQKHRLTIVDYGHEEGAMSPEAEEGEIMATGRVMYGEKLQTIDGEFVEIRSSGISRQPTPSTHATPPQSSEPIDQPESDTMNYSSNGLESAENEDAVMDAVGEQENIDPFDTFLPPPPKEKCSEELQEKIIKFLALKKNAGRSFNSEVRNRKEYRNPDFLLHAVTYQNIDQIGSCFSKDVFDPHGYDKSDFYDEIEADMRREIERREQERKKSQKLDFVSGGSQPPNIPTPKISIPTPGLGGGVSNITPSTSDVTARDGRQNKKSKWDKVDVDQRNSLVTGGQENLAHATLLSAAKAGSGYSAFAQQRRKDAEDKRLSDRKSERRT
ncbi:hypothetical protein ACJIZ3_006654 [Penstemon smallii]|uniref:SAP30-binding protein n=1 Tax=Penstemon smallii TaxID=265156 RepID=A0ABD3S8A9_9LAMI